MLPGERALVERLKNEPFALLGINSDERSDDEGNLDKAATLEYVRGMLVEEKVSWRQGIDWSTSGPLATQWNVQGWPTLYVLDENGTIRWKGHDEASMTKAVDEALEALRARR